METKGEIFKMALLELQQVEKKFGGIIALSDISFAVEKNDILGLIGPNGAGKTTVFNLVTRAYDITGGLILFNGKSIKKLRPDQIINLGVARTFQNIRLFRKLTVLDNIKVSLCHKAAYNVFDALSRTSNYKKMEKAIEEEARALLKEMELDKYVEIQSDNLAYGLQRKLEIARALALAPKLLLLDEPAAGMNPKEVTDIISLIKKIHSKYNLTIIIIEHHMNVITNLCNNIIVLNFGKKIAEGKPEEIQKNPEVIEAYLGSSTQKREEERAYVRN